MFKSRNVKKYTAVLMIGAMAVASGCTSTGGGGGGGDGYGGGEEASVPPARQRWIDANRRFNRTVATGAVAGAVAGAVIGALVSRRNRVAGAAIGAAAGGAIGAGIGLYVASQNRKYANREEELRAKTSAADQEAVAYRQTADAAEEYAVWQRRRIRRMKADLRAKRITQAQYNAEREKAKKQAAVMRKRASEADKVQSEIDKDRKRLRAEGKSTRPLAQSEADLLRSKQRFNKAANDIEAEL